LVRVISQARFRATPISFTKRVGEAEGAAPSKGFT
jgi:hypothetical protein